MIIISPMVNGFVGERNEEHQFMEDWSSWMSSHPRDYCEISCHCLYSFY